MPLSLEAGQEERRICFEGDTAFVLLDEDEEEGGRTVLDVEGEDEEAGFAKVPEDD